MVYYLIYDPETGDLLDQLDDDDRCRGWPPPCGGCGHCMMLQASHAGLRVEELEVTSEAFEVLVGASPE